MRITYERIPKMNWIIPFTWLCFAVLFYINPMFSFNLGSSRETQTRHHNSFFEDINKRKKGTFPLLLRHNLIMCTCVENTFYFYMNKWYIRTNTLRTKCPLLNKRRKRKKKSGSSTTTTSHKRKR